MIAALIQINTIDTPAKIVTYVVFRVPQSEKHISLLCTNLKVVKDNYPKAINSKVVVLSALVFCPFPHPCTK